MKDIEITSLSSRGQVVIPQGIREDLHLNTGEKFIVIGKSDTIILKKIEMPSFEGFDKLLKKTREFAKIKKINSKDVKQAIKKARKR
ncbi:MAG: AbrB/MazE/SpoVT family DNA-binding domain-containing protein [Nanoarchaeota archaeon]|nr:AbrB/MazE/SpoVT family DNA-binding domain-containing protein [Nanoarchaeota archaeon]